MRMMFAALAACFFLVFGGNPALADDTAQRLSDLQEQVTELYESNDALKAELARLKASRGQTQTQPQSAGGMTAYQQDYAVCAAEERLMCDKNWIYAPSTDAADESRTQEHIRFVVNEYKCNRFIAPTQLNKRGVDVVGAYMDMRDMPDSSGHVPEVCPADDRRDAAPAPDHSGGRDDDHQSDDRAPREPLPSMTSILGGPSFAGVTGATGVSYRENLLRPFNGEAATAINESSIGVRVGRGPGATNYGGLYVVGTASYLRGPMNTVGATGSARLGFTPPTLHGYFALEAGASVTSFDVEERDSNNTPTASTLLGGVVLGAALRPLGSEHLRIGGDLDMRFGAREGGLNEDGEEAKRTNDWKEKAPTVVASAAFIF